MNPADIEIIGNGLLVHASKKDEKYPIKSIRIQIYY
jgi:hypothetical protein